MRTAILKRSETGDEGTFGLITTDTFRTFVSGEDPWRDLDGDGIGDVNFSCVNAGTFFCQWVMSPRLKYCRYRLANVPGRSGILMHAGTYVGDKKLGLESDSEGCIIIGSSLGISRGQKCLEKSRDALAEFENEFNHQSFELTIVDAYN